MSAPNHNDNEKVLIAQSFSTLFALVLSLLELQVGCPAVSSISITSEGLVDLALRVRCVKNLAYTPFRSFLAQGRGLPFTSGQRRFAILTVWILLLHGLVYNMSIS